jgi:drug/metabolite transporter (DMT)-like permease
VCAATGVLGFSFKAILIKLAYAAHPPLDAVTLLALRMLFSAPFFVALAWWASRRPGVRPFTRGDWTSLAWLGFIGYYLASLVDFMGLKYISAGLERLVLFLYPTIVVLLSALWEGRPITRRTLAALVISYAGIALVFLHDLHFAEDATALATGGALVLASAFLYAVYLVRAAAIIGRVGSLRFIAWAMLASTVFVLLQFGLTREVTLLVVPASIYWISLAMAVFSTVLPTWLVAEAIRRMGSNATSLLGSVGPVFTIGLGAMILGEPVYPVQLVGAALVLVGVTLVTLRRRRSPVAETAEAP